MLRHLYDLCAWQGSQDKQAWRTQSVCSRPTLHPYLQKLPRALECKQVKTNCMQTGENQLYATCKKQALLIVKDRHGWKSEFCLLPVCRGQKVPSPWPSIPWIKDLCQHHKLQCEFLLPLLLWARNALWQGAIRWGQMPRGSGNGSGVMQSGHAKCIIWVPTGRHSCTRWLEGKVQRILPLVCCGYHSGRNNP